MRAIDNVIARMFFRLVFGRFFLHAGKGFVAQLCALQSVLRHGVHFARVITKAHKALIVLGDGGPGGNVGGCGDAGFGEVGEEVDDVTVSLPIGFINSERMSMVMPRRASHNIASLLCCLSLCIYYH
jgi:hypothetical protein